MDILSLVTAAQIERGMRFYMISFHPKEVKLEQQLITAKTFLEPESGALVLLEQEGRYRVGRVSQELPDLNLASAAAAEWWLVDVLDQQEQEAKRLNKQERDAERLLSRSIALREATAALDQMGMSAAQLFGPAE